MTLLLTRRAGALALAATLLPRVGPARAQAAKSILVYNAQHQALTKEWADGFKAESGIDVVLRNGDDTELGNQIVQEGKASPADVFLTENSPAMALVDRAGLFAPLPASITDEVAPAFRVASGHWAAIAARSTVLAYNKDKVGEGELPGSIMDLADPKWRRRWAASPSGADFQAIVGAMLLLKGETATLAWLRAMKQNVVTYRGNTTAMKAVNAGQVEMAVIYHYYFFGDQAKTGENSAHVALHYFRHEDPGAFVSLSGGGVLASSAKKEAAEAFLRWVAGKGGQAVLRQGSSYEYAVGQGEASNPKLVPLAELQAPHVDASALDSKRVTELMMQAGLL